MGENRLYCPFSYYHGNYNIFFSLLGDKEMKKGKEEKENKGILPGGKAASKGSQIFAASWIIVLTILKALELVKLEIDEIIYSGFAIAGIFIPVYFSIWLEKIRDIRFGKQ
jgi:hypothetical protein